MPSISLAVSGQTSDAYEVGAGARVTASGSGYVEWTSGTLTDVRNGAASWSTWPKGATTGYADTLRRVCIRGVATGELTVTWDEGERDEGPDDAYWQEQVPAWSLDSSGNVQGLVGPADEIVTLVEVTPYVNLTATGTAFTGACELAGYDCTVAAGNITIYDNTSAAGTVIVPTTALSVGRTEFTWKRALTTGCHVVLSGAATVNVLVG